MILSELYLAALTRVSCLVGIDCSKKLDLVVET